MSSFVSASLGDFAAAAQYLTGVGSSITSANTAAAGSTTQLGVMLAGIDGCRSYCGRSADEHGGLPARRYSRMDRAGPLPASQSCRPSWHLLGPLDMLLEAKRFGHVAVAIP